MSHHSYSYYGHVSFGLIFTVIVLPPAILALVLLLLFLSKLARLCLARTKKGSLCLNKVRGCTFRACSIFRDCSIFCCCNKVCDKIWLYKFTVLAFFVSTTVIVAQLFFGAGAIKQKRRNPSVLVINGKQYKLNGWVLGSIAYYNCVVIYVIIAVSIGFINHQIPWSLEACQSNADCYYFINNSFTIVIQNDEPTVKPIINCTLDEAYDVKYVFCYDIGFHPVVGIAMLSSFIKVGTPLLFAFVTRFHVLFGEKIIKMKKYNRKRITVLGVCFGISMLIQILFSLILLILLVINYIYISDVEKNSFRIFFSNEAYISQGIGLFFVHFLFVSTPFFHIENYRIPEVENNEGQNNVFEEDPPEVNEETRLIQGEKIIPNYGSLNFA